MSESLQSNGTPIIEPMLIELAGRTWVHPRIIEMLPWREPHFVFNGMINNDCFRLINGNLTVIAYIPLVNERLNRVRTDVDTETFIKNCRRCFRGEVNLHEVTGMIEVLLDEDVWHPDCIEFEQFVEDEFYTFLHEKWERKDRWSMHDTVCLLMEIHGNERDFCYST